jgi:hypothetical protein
MSDARTVRRSPPAVVVMPVVLLAAAAAGCAQQGSAMAPASGVVTLGGRPVAGAQVTFMAPTAARAAYGTTDAAGRFVLSTFGTGDGATPGQHVVTITKPGTDVAAPAMSAEQADAAYSAAMTQASRNAAARGDLPARYADAARSGLTAEVTTTGPNEFVFALEP